MAPIKKWRPAWPAGHVLPGQHGLCTVLDVALDLAVVLFSLAVSDRALGRGVSLSCLHTATALYQIAAIANRAASMVFLSVTTAATRNAVCAGIRQRERVAGEAHLLAKTFRFTVCPVIQTCEISGWLLFPEQTRR